MPEGTNPPADCCPATGEACTEDCWDSLGDPVCALSMTPLETADDVGALDGKMETDEFSTHDLQNHLAERRAHLVERLEQLAAGAELTDDEAEKIGEGLMNDDMIEQRERDEEDDDPAGALADAVIEQRELARQREHHADNLVGREHTDGPELSLEQAQANVANKAHPRVSKESIEERIRTVRYIEDGTGTFCIIEMVNGFETNGFSKPADPRNFDREVGRRYAYENAFRNLWQLEGYLLCEYLTTTATEDPTPDAGETEMHFPPGVQTYRSHKLVDAGKIIGIARAYRDDDPQKARDPFYELTIGQVVVRVTAEYLDRLPGGMMQGAIGGYFVRYEDGYVSWSPAEAFEAGYHRDV